MLRAYAADAWGGACRDANADLVVKSPPCSAPWSALCSCSLWNLLQHTDGRPNLCSLHGVVSLHEQTLCVRRCAGRWWFHGHVLICTGLDQPATLHLCPLHGISAPGIRPHLQPVPSGLLRACLRLRRVPARVLCQPPLLQHQWLLCANRAAREGSTPPRITPPAAWWVLLATTAEEAQCCTAPARTKRGLRA